MLQRGKIVSGLVHDSLKVVHLFSVLQIAYAFAFVESSI